MEAIASKGGALKDAWKQQGHESSMVGEFKHPSVVLDADQVRQMQADISSHRDQQQPTRPLSSVSR